MTEEIEPHIYKKYEVLEKKGKGAYGIVWKAIDRKTNQVVALKKVFDAFHNDTDAQRTFREIMLLQELNGHDNIIKLFNVIKAENNKDIYLVFEYMEIDLHKVNRSNILQDIHKVFIMYQMVKCLKFLHSAEIVHRDLKPANILIDAECNVKVADFGLARSINKYDDESAPVMTDYVATRWYRAPEIVLGSCQYSKAVDMWSVGCILGELVNGKAIFPGKSTINQVERIVKLLGKPTRSDMESINAADIALIENLNTKKKYSFSGFFKGASKEALDFLRRTLLYNPSKRMTAEEALKHPFVRQFHDPSEEIVCDKIIRLPISDAKKLSLKEYRDALYRDIWEKKDKQRKKRRMKYLEQLGISAGATNEDIQKAIYTREKRKAELARERARRKRDRESREYRKSKQYGQYANYAKSKEGYAPNGGTYYKGGTKTTTSSYMDKPKAKERTPTYKKSDYEGGYKQYKGTSQPKKKYSNHY